MSESSSNLSREYSQKHIRGGEKKVMKKTLSSVVSIALISSMFATAAFAAETTSTPETTTTSVSATKELTTQEKYDALKAAGVFEGDDTGANLEGLTDRAQIAKIISKAFGLTENASGASVYNDEAFETPEFKWSLGFVGAVTKAGFMDGVWEGVFDPASNVTHEQIATILVKAFKLEHPATEKVEGEVSDWAKGYVAAAVKAGLIKAQADYTVAAKRSDLVESAWSAIELKKELETPVANSKVASVETLSNNLIEVTLSEEVKAAVASDFKIAGADNSALEVKGAKLISAKVVQLTTAAQTGGALYTITANGTSEKFVGLPADTTAPKLSSAVATKNNKIEVVFDEDVLNVDNIANYTFSNGLTAVSAAYKVENDVVNKSKVIVTTSAQTQGTIYKLTVASGLTDFSGNSVNTSNNTYDFGGLPADETKPTVDSAVALNNTKVNVVFNEEVDKATAETISNYSIEGLSVVKAELQSNGTTVKLTTAAQTQGTIYKVVVTNVKDEAGNVVNTDKNSFQFGGLPADTEKPQVQSAVSSGNTTVTVAFTETVDKASAETAANYTIEGLAVSKAELQSDNLSVKLTTAAQTQGTIYKVVVANVKDESNNVVNGDHNSFQFGGLAADTAKPQVVSATSTANNKVKVIFNEVISTPKSYNFSFDNSLGYGLKVKKLADSNYADGQVWEVQTLAQSSAVYTLTVNDVTDTSGNVINSDYRTATVGGYVATDSAAPKVSSAAASDNQTVVVTFNKALDGGSLNKEDFVFSVNSGTEVAGSVISNVYADKFLLSDDKTKVTLQFADPNKMTPTVVYKVTVAGVTGTNGTVIAGTDNSAIFAGMSIANTAPKVASAGLVNNQTLTIYFDKAISIEGGVAALAAGDFSIPGFTGQFVQGKLSADKKALTLYYTNSASPALATDTFKTPQLYNVTVNNTGGKFKDALGVRALDTSKVGSFAAINSSVTVPKISTIIAVDKNTVDVVFDQTIQLTSNIKDDITVTTHSGEAVTHAVYGARAEGSDGNKIRVFFNSTSDFKNGYLYKLNINNAVQGVQNLNGVKIAANTSFNFAAIGTTNPAPKLALASAISGTKVQVKFSEKVVANWDSAALFTIGGETIAAGNITKADGTDINNGDAVDTIIVTVPQKVAGSIQELGINAGITDEFNTAVADATVKVKFSAK